jgi:uncharacterized lipoprotein YmbA
MMTARPLCRICAPTTVAAVALVALVAIGGGCSLSRPAPVKQVFLIDSPAPPPVASTHPGTLQLRAVNLAAQFRGRSIVYRETDLRYVADFYSEFLVAPGAMLGEATARGLEHARVFARVVPPGAPPEGNLVLDGFADAFYIDVRDADKSIADVSVTFFLARGDPASPVPFWSKQYQRRVPASGSGVEAQVAALSNAFGDITAELARDLAALQLPKP